MSRCGRSLSRGWGEATLHLPWMLLAWMPCCVAL